MVIASWRGTATAALSAAALVGVLPLPVAHADDTGIHQPQMDALCQAQYPGRNTPFNDGSAYIVAPGDAYSWRCQQTSRSGAGAISNLGINPAAYCSMSPNLGGPVLKNPGSPDGWVCRT